MIASIFYFAGALTLSWSVAQLRQDMAQKDEKYRQVVRDFEKMLEEKQEGEQ